MVRYAKFSSASASGSECYSAPFGSSLEQAIDVQSTDTQASLFRDDNEGEFILAFPGTASRRDGATDGFENKKQFLTQSGNFRRKNKYECDGCYVHGGFYTAHSSAVDSYRQALDTGLQSHPNYNISVTGHSLGGALANLAFAALANEDYPVTHAFTYGQPRVGNQEYADFVDKLSGAKEDHVGIYKRVTHVNDAVPQLPDLQHGFRHSRTEMFQENGAFGSQDASNTYRCYGQESKACNRKSAHGGDAADAHMHYSGIELGQGCGGF